MCNDRFLYTDRHMHTEALVLAVFHEEQPSYENKYITTCVFANVQKPHLQICPWICFFNLKQNQGFKKKNVVCVLIFCVDFFAPRLPVACGNCTCCTRPCWDLLRHADLSITVENESVHLFIVKRPHLRAKCGNQKGQITEKPPLPPKTGKKG